MDASTIKYMLKKGIQKRNVFLAYFSVAIMVLVTWNTAVQEAMAVEGSPSGSISHVVYRVEAGDDELQEGVNLTIEGSILIESGGRLTIRNSMIRIDSETDGLERIELSRGGELIIENSTIKANRSSKRYRFLVNSTLFINGSTIQDLYGEDKIGGIEIGSTNPIAIRNTTIKDTKTTGIFIRNGTPLLENLTIENSVYGIYLFSPTSTPASPKADLTIDDTVKRVGSKFTMDATSSLGDITQYYWDFGDGEIGNGLYTNHTYSAPGVYDLFLHVVDVNGSEDTESIPVQVLNAQPVPLPYADNYRPAINETVRLDGGSSYDPDGAIMEYKWDINGTSTEYGPIVECTFNSSGEKTVSLQVMDDVGEIVNEEITIEVSSDQAPVPDTGGDQITYVDRVTSFDATESTDPDGSITGYLWDFGDGSAPSSGSTVTHTYTEKGAYVVSLTITDNDDVMAEDTCVVLVKEHYWPEMKYNRYRRATSEDPGPTSNSNASELSLTSTSWYHSKRLVDSGPVVDNGTIYMGAGDTFGAYDAVNLSTKWDFDTSANFVSTAAVFEDHVVAIALEDDEDVWIYDFDTTPEDGVDEGYDDPNGVDYDIIWRYVSYDQTTTVSPLIHNGRAYITLNDDNNIYIYAYDIEGTTDGCDGNVCDDITHKYDYWSLSPGGLDGDTVHSSALLGKIMVVPLNETQYTSSEDVSVIALNHTTNEIIWDYYGGGGQALTPSIHDDRVAVAFTNGTVTIFDLDMADEIDEGVEDTSGANFDRVYTHNFSVDISLNGSVVYDGDRLYVSGVDNSSVYAMNVSNSITELWNYTLPSGVICQADIGTTGDMVYIPTNNTTGNDAIYALYLDNGSLAFTYAVNDAVHSPVAIAGGSLLVHDMSGSLHKVNRTTSVPGDLDYDQLNITTVIGEVGQVTNLTNTDFKVELKHNYTNPVVIAKPLTIEDSSPSHVRIREVNSTNFTMFVEEWDYLDGDHSTAENVTYMVVEEGRYILEGGAMLEAGSQSIDDSWTTVDLNASMPITPVLMTQSQSVNENDAIVTRVRSIDTSSFQIMLQEEEDGDAHTYETVGYMAVTPYFGNSNGTTVEVNNTTDSVTNNWYTINFDLDYEHSPLFLASQQRTDESDTSGLRYQSLDNTSVQVKVEEEQSSDPEVTHTTEAVGYLIFGKSTDILARTPVGGYLISTSDYDAYTNVPDYNGSMYLASGHLQDWRDDGGPSNVKTAQEHIRDAVINWSDERYNDALGSVQSAVDHLLSIGSCNSTADCKIALRTLGNASMNESRDFAERAEYTAGEGNVYVERAWANHTSGETYLENEDFSNSTTKFNNSIHNSILAFADLEPDLTFEAGSLSFTKYNVTWNKSIDINVTVVNRGLGDSDQTVLRFYMGDPANNDSVQLGSNTSVGSLSYLETYDASISHTFTKHGIHDIYAILDKNGTVNESDEDNNQVYKSLWVTDGSPFPRMRYIAFSNNTVGLYVNGTSSTGGFNLTLENSTFYNNSQDDIKVTNAGYVRTVDSYYSWNKVTATDTSSVDRYWSFDLWTKDASRDISDNASIAYTPNGGSQVSSSSDENGYYNTHLKECTFTSSGVSYSTPHLIEIDPSGGDNSQAYLTMDGPRSATIHEGGDADKDAYLDSDENNDDTHWLEAENHFYLPSQKETDFLAFPVGPNGTAIKALENGSITDPDTFMKMSAGTYFVYMRAKYTTSNDETSPTVDLNVTGDGLHSRTFELTTSYRWYHVDGVSMTSTKHIQIGINENTTSGDVEVLVDRIMIHRWKESGTVQVALGQTSDPILPDADWDRGPDGTEIRPSSYWYEGEDFPTGSSTIGDNVNASNSKEIEPTAQSTNFVSISFDASDTTTYLIYARAKGESSAALDLNVDAVNKDTFSLKENYTWFVSEVDMNQGTRTITFDSPTATYYSTVELDVVHIDIKDKVYIDTLRDGGGSPLSSPFSVTDGSDATYYLKVPEKSYMTNATFEFTDDLGYDTYNLGSGGSSDPAIDGDFEVHVNGGNLIVTNLSDDTDGDGRPDPFENPPSVTTYTINQNSVSNPSISGDYVVYESSNGIDLLYLMSDLDNDGTPDWKDVNQLPATWTLDNSGNEPDISDTNVVWEKGGSIYWYDFKRGLGNPGPTQISSAQGNHYNPRISGDNVVYDDGSDVYLTTLSTWGEGFDDPRDPSASNRKSSSSNKISQSLTGYTQNPCESPDIHGQFVVWREAEAPGMYHIILLDLKRESSTIQLTQASGENDPPRVHGDKVVWIEMSNTVYSYDLARDTDDDGVPNYLETPIQEGPAGVYMGMNAANVEVNGHYIAWDDEDLVKIGRAYLGIDVGNSTYDYFSSDLEQRKPRYVVNYDTVRTRNLKDPINEYIANNDPSNGYYDVPVTFHTESSQQVTITLNRVTAYSGFVTNPLNHDSDGDHVFDGDEILDFFGIDIIETEDAVFMKEWKNPMLEGIDNMDARIKEPAFMHQGGVTLTSSNNITRNETVRDSYVTIPWRAPTDGTYKIRVWPNAEVSRVADVVWYPRYECQNSGDEPCDPTNGELVLSSYYPLNLQGHDVSGLGLASGYLQDVIEEAVYVRIKPAGGEIVDPSNETISGSVEKVENGTETGNGTDSGKGMVSIHLAYEGKFYFQGATNYELTIGVDLDRLNDTLLNPENDLFTNLSMLRILDLDYLRVERKVLDPLDTDADDDFLPDGEEATSTGFPLNDDPDEDGLTDYVETMITDTDPMRRDTDLDGIRDGVELGNTSAELVSSSSFGSWFERIAKSGTPFDYSWIDNYDSDNGASTTDPNDIDTDDDGLPDGWIDRWIYQHSPIDYSEKRSYMDTLNLLKKEYRYDVDRWGNGGEIDHMVQVYEGEDLDLDGTRDSGANTHWNFTEDTKERWSISNFCETEPGTGAEGDGDSVPDGYEVWYSSYYEPMHLGNTLLFDPTTSDGTTDKDPAYQVSEDTTDLIGNDPALNEMGKTVSGKGDVVALGQRMSFYGESVFGASPLGITQIQVQLNMSQDTDSKVTMEIYDGRMDDVWANDKQTNGSTRSLVEGLETVGYSDGWYNFNLPNDVFTVDQQNKVYYIILRYVPNNGNPAGWYGAYVDGSSHQSIYQDADGEWHEDKQGTVHFLYKIRLLTEDTDNRGDHVTLFEEYLAGTNPKMRNTDYLEIGTVDKNGTFNDHLLDGYELGWDSGDTCGATNYDCAIGGIIYRTSVEDGALVGTNYDGADDPQWIEFDPDGDSGSTWRTTKYLGDETLEDPEEENKTLDDGNELIFTLEDGTEIYMRPDGDPSSNYISSELYVFDGGLNEDSTYYDSNGTERVRTTVHVYSKDSVSNTLSTAKLEDQGSYRNQMIFLGDPNDPDTDDDGIADGLETERNETSGWDDVIRKYEFDRTGWKNNTEESYGEVYDDGMINARDRDSDNDGLLDSQEKPHYMDYDEDGFVNYADPDADNDGLLDGDELQPSVDTDNDGSTQTSYLCIDFCTNEDIPAGSDYDLNVTYIHGANGFDSDSDGDDVGDGAEMIPYMLINDSLDPSQETVYSNVTLLNNVAAGGPVALSSSRDIYYGSGGDLYVLEDYDRFDRPWNNMGRELVSKNNPLSEIAVYGDSFVYFHLEGKKKIFQYSIYYQSIVEEYVPDPSHAIDALAVDGSGYVYAAVNKDVYKIDFGGESPSAEKIYTHDDTGSEITSLSVNDNGDLVFIFDATGGDNNHQLIRAEDPYSDWDDLVASDDALDHVRLDPGGGIYYVLTDGTSDNLNHLPQDYTSSVLKNSYLMEDMGTYKKNAITGLDVSSQYDMMVMDSDNRSIEGYIGSRSSPVKTDSDGDGLEDGPSGEIDDRTYDINHVGTDHSTLSGAYTYPTISDSDNDGLKDGVEVDGYTIHVNHSKGTADISVSSDPSRSDTDGDGLNDRIEYHFANPLERDTDQDGLEDAVEDADGDGYMDRTETCTVLLDTDKDGLADGWNDTGADGDFNTRDPGEMDGIRQAGEAFGEDFDLDTVNDENEPDPLLRDSDGDTLADGEETDYLVNNSYDYDNDADGDGTIDVLEPDADADGFRDNVENHNHDDALDHNETDPYDPDTDGDGLADGVEPMPFMDISDETGDTDVNGRDTDSNDAIDDDHTDSFVVLRTTATDTDGDGLLNFEDGTEIATYASTSASLDDAISRYEYSTITASLPGGADELGVDYQGETSTVRTPDQRDVFICANSSDFDIYIEVSGTEYIKYITGGSEVSTGKKALEVSDTLSHSNEMSEHRITMDWRKAMDNDIDNDGLNNSDDPCSTDRDWDDDGLPDGRDPDFDDPDFDNDGLSDGLESGVQNAIEDTTAGGTYIHGTDTSETFEWYYDGVNHIDVSNFTADQDPTTHTEPNRSDTDGDGLEDGIEEANMWNVSEESTLGTCDLNGKVDGTNETDPLDMDTDDDGLVDGWIDYDNDGAYSRNEGEDFDCDGLIENLNDINETEPWTFDTDGDGLGDGLEGGIDLHNISSDTNTSVFSPDVNTSSTTDPTVIDTDGDHVPDGWIDGWTCDPEQGDDIFGKYDAADGEFQFGEGEDEDLDGNVSSVETDPNVVDSDEDGLLDGWDVIGDSEEYKKIFSTSYGDDSRYWGELNYSTHELLIGEGESKKQDTFTDPTSNDTDGDGLLDGCIDGEDGPWELEKIHNGITQDYYTDPSLMDTDEDGLSDGLEVAGWEVHIIFEKTKKEKKNGTVFSDPTVTDMDDDGVNDFQEFQNGSDPDKEDTDGDHIVDGNESQGELTQIEGKDPEFLEVVSGAQVRLVIEEKYGEHSIFPEEIFLRAKVRVRDNAGLETVSVKISGQSRKDVELKNNPREAVVDVKFEMDWARSLTIGFDINVTVMDVNGNGNCTETHIDGLLEGVIKELIDKFWAFVEAVKEAASQLFSWIWDMIDTMMETVVKPIYDCITHWIKDMLNLIKDTFEPLYEGMDEAIDIAEFVEQTFTLLLLPMTILTTILLVATAIEVIVTAASMGMTHILSSVASSVAGIILTVIGMAIIEGELLKQNSVQSFVENNVDDTAVSVLEITTTISMLGIEAKMKTLATPSLVFGVLSILITALGIAFADGWPLLILDIVGLVLLFYAIRDFFQGPDEKVREAVSPLLYRCTRVLDVVSFIKTPIEILAHLDDYRKGDNPVY